MFLNGYYLTFLVKNAIINYKINQGMVNMNYREKDKIILSAVRGDLKEELMNYEILSLNSDTEGFRHVLDGFGATIAHILVEYSKLPKKMMTLEILSLKDSVGWSVAHYLARKGKLPKKMMSLEILSLRDDRGQTVAHVLANYGNLPKKMMTSKILNLKFDEVSVLDFIESSENLVKKSIKSFNAILDSIILKKENYKVIQKMFYAMEGFYKNIKKEDYIYIKSG